MLTRRQKEVYDFIKSYIKENDYAPTLNEIKVHLQITSVSTAHYHVKNLIKFGYIERNSQRPGSFLIPQNILVSESRVNLEQESFSVPMYGAANAGLATMIAAQNVESYIKVPIGFETNKDDIFALRVKGDSMNQAQIDGKNLEDGDYVLIDANYRSPQNGDYVISIIDDLANLKKFERNEENGAIRLISESSNPNHKPIYVSSEDNFMVNGKIIAVLKK